MTTNLDPVPRTSTGAALLLAGAACLGDASALTSYDDPNAYALPAGMPSPAAFLQLTDLAGGVSSCSGALLAPGSFVLTAAHCLTGDTADPAGYDKNGKVQSLTVQLPSTGTLAPIAANGSTVTLHPDWNGNLEDGHDLALIRLPQQLADPVGYSIYPAAFDNYPAAVQLLGYGLGGQGAVELDPNGVPLYDYGTLRSGWNHYDAPGAVAAAFPDPSLFYFFDFDDYSTASNVIGEPGWVTICCDGNGDPVQTKIMVDWNGGSISDAVLAEVMLALGDSGGPTWNVELGLIGIHSAVSKADSSFGAVGVDTPVYLYRDWINEVMSSTPVPLPATLWQLPGALLVLMPWLRRVAPS